MIGNVSTAAFPLRVVKKPSSSSDGEKSLADSVDDKSSGGIAKR